MLSWRFLLVVAVRDSVSFLHVDTENIFLLVNKMIPISLDKSFFLQVFFSPLGKLADWAIYFSCINFFIFSDHLENNYLRIYWTDFQDFFFTR